jgi:hypothetical protein
MKKNPHRKYRIYSYWKSEFQGAVKEEHHFAEAWKWAWNWWRLDEFDAREQLIIVKYDDNGKAIKKWSIAKLGEYIVKG